MVRLLVVKSGTRYIRFTDEGHQLCAMAKASVFPLEQLPLVQQKIEQAESAGASSLQLCQLTIIEKPYDAEA